ncbi:MAG: bifunctional diaminohydroxyphosphoribosylaminopyrimidine deaminase/5-amino-6-(5-phosphoribosylamino)uracil reductase RibD [Alphaproteobacteria bacterium]|nr:bifunctional diaminohydroxyphosphoribosylaminopyrimidine deaminase/5-amino-6-(5-phosphoribosylamino)uracil reductase RibD [Alphaproteobacteria bacterium]
MRAALGLARRGLGRVWPNPAVGCVIVREGRVVGRGWTQPGGRPHAETEALARAGGQACGATAYVTLEPCSHHGKTPPCADALVEAGLARVVMAHEDPDPRVAGRGAARLRAAGIEVVSGVLEAEARSLNAGFLSRVARGRPIVTLKLATSLDGRIATATGESQWITGAEARAQGHRLRAEHDAILIGIGTALADDPSLTCRLPGMEPRSPVRVVLDSRLRLPRASRLASSGGPTWIVTREGAESQWPQANTSQRPEAGGVEVIGVRAGQDGRPDPLAVLESLGGRGLTRVLLEGGGEAAASFIRLGLVDVVVWFHAPLVLGGDGKAAVAAFGLDRLADSPIFTRSAVTGVGPDVMELYERAR